MGCFLRAQICFVFIISIVWNWTFHFLTLRRSILLILLHYCLQNNTAFFRNYFYVLNIAKKIILPSNQHTKTQPSHNQLKKNNHNRPTRPNKDNGERTPLLNPIQVEFVQPRVKTQLSLTFLQPTLLRRTNNGPWKQGDPSFDLKSDQTPEQWLHVGRNRLSFYTHMCNIHAICRMVGSIGVHFLV